MAVHELSDKPRGQSTCITPSEDAGTRQIKTLLCRSVTLGRT